MLQCRLSVGRSGARLASTSLKNVFSEEARKKRRAAIEQEMEKGYFDEIKEFTQTTVAKKKPAALTLTPATEAAALPALTGRLLSNKSTVDAVQYMKEHGASFLIINYRDSGRQQAAAWRECVKLDNASGSKPSTIGLLELSIVENPAFRLISGLMTSSLRKVIPEAHHASHAVCLQVPEGMRKQLQIGNRLFPNVYLVDRAARVRWHAFGPPTPEEKAFVQTGLETLRVEST